MANYVDLIGGIIFLSMGIAFVIFHKFVGDKSAEFINKQHKALRWGLKSSAAINSLCFLGAGILFIFFGLKLLFY